MRSSLTSRRVPRPPHLGHAPNGELNENWRGSSSASEVPHVGAAVPLGEERDGVVVVALHLDEAVGELERRLDRVGEARAVVCAHDEPIDDHRDAVVYAAC